MSRSRARTAPTFAVPAVQSFDDYTRSIAPPPRVPVRVITARMTGPDRCETPPGPLRRYHTIHDANRTMHAAAVHAPPSVQAGWWCVVVCWDAPGRFVTLPVRIAAAIPQESTPLSDALMSLVGMAAGRCVPPGFALEEARAAVARLSEADQDHARWLWTYAAGPWESWDG